MTREELLEWQAAQRAAGKSHGPTPMKDDTPKYMVRTKPKRLFFTHPFFVSWTSIHLNLFCCVIVSMTVFVDCVRAWLGAVGHDVISASFVLGLLLSGTILLRERSRHGQII